MDISDDSLTRDELMRLYELALQQHERASERVHQRFAYWVTICSSLVAGTIFALINSPSAWLTLLVLVGPLLLIVGSRVAIQHCKHGQRVLLEAVSIRAKLEDALGLSTAFPVPETACWPGEPLVPPRHLKTRKEFGTSEAFIESLSTGGDLKRSRMVFLWFRVAALVLTLGVVIRALEQAGYSFAVILSHSN